MNRKHLFRTLRNLGLSALVGLVIWSLADFPLPMEQEFRRSERTHLAARSDIVWTHEGTTVGDDDLLVGLSDTAVHVWHPNGYVLFWPRQEEGTLVSLPAETRYQDRANSYLGPALLVADPPEGADAARLTITLSHQDWSEDYVVEGERQGQVFFFQLEMHHRDDAHSQDETNAFIWVTINLSHHMLYPCTVEFFDGAGEFLSVIQPDSRMTVVSLN